MIMEATEEGKLQFVVTMITIYIYIYIYNKKSERNNKRKHYN